MFLPVLFVVVAGVLFVLVVLQRRLGRRWSAAPRGAARVRAQDFGPVWLQSVAPRAAIGPLRDRRVGTLSTEPEAGRARFVAKDGAVTELTGIRRVEVGGKGSDVVNTWVEVELGEGKEKRAVYLNDAGWLGWRALVTSSNRRIARALQDLRVEGQTGS